MLNNDGTGNPIYTSFDGVASSATDVLIKYTYYGDTNLDGVVDGSDYSRIDSAYLADQTDPTAMTGWFNGDFNYDGFINGSDYTLIDNAFNSQTTPLSDQLAGSLAQATVRLAGASVPEPSTLGLIAIGLPILLGRRRWRRVANG